MTKNFVEYLDLKGSRLKGVFKIFIKWTKKTTLLTSFRVNIFCKNNPCVFICNIAEGTIIYSQELPRNFNMNISQKCGRVWNLNIQKGLTIFKFKRKKPKISDSFENCFYSNVHRRKTPVAIIHYCSCLHISLHIFHYFLVHFIFSHGRCTISVLCHVCHSTDFQLCVPSQTQ